MTEPQQPPDNGPKFVAPRRKTISLSETELVEIMPLQPDRSLPHVIRPVVSGVDLGQWLESNRTRVDGLLDQFGAILFRGFAVRDVRHFEELMTIASGPALEYLERSTPRRQLEIGQRVYTSTEYPASQSILMHCENSYQRTFPQRIAFHCRTAAATGGATPLADCRRVYQRIEPELRQRFEERGIGYIRNFGGGLGLSWQEALQTSDRDEVERYCHDAGITAEWLDGDRLQIRTVLPATITHPRTGERSWFNHGVFFHPTMLPATVRETMLASLSEEELPNRTTYGDGEPIAAADIAHIHDAYVQEMRRFDWHNGDLLLVDNLLVAHGRDPFEGPREIWAAMASPTTRPPLGSR